MWGVTPGKDVHNGDDGAEEASPAPVVHARVQGRRGRVGTQPGKHALAGREIQRIGLSATLGNAEELLGWLTATSTGAGRVVRPPAETGGTTEVTLDYVGSLADAAVAISQLHRSEERLVFVHRLAHRADEHD